jgi:GTP cyclohydrolase I
MTALTTPTGGAMPDVARHAKSPFTGTLDKVGMTAIEVPVLLAGPDGVTSRTPAKADAFVSLDDPKAKGIHMSRLYLTLNNALESEPLSLGLVRRILAGFVESHQGLSHSASLSLGFDHLLRRPALRSNNSAWRSYPVTMSGDLCVDAQGEFRARFRLGVTVAYSSTCPCSAALARQLVQAEFQAEFAGKDVISLEEAHAWLGKESSIVATPHAQRSYAVLEIEVADLDRAPGFIELIDLVEGALRTPVQAAVKREDEQEFARLNGQNLMFCEDAGRRLKDALDRDGRIADFRVEAVHVESLHPHNAVSIVTKGVPGGFTA